MHGTWEWCITRMGLSCNHHCHVLPVNTNRAPKRTLPERTLHALQVCCCARRPASLLALVVDQWIAA